MWTPPPALPIKFTLKNDFIIIIFYFFCFSGNVAAQRYRLTLAPATRTAFTLSWRVNFLDVCYPTVYPVRPSVPLSSSAKLSLALLLLPSDRVETKGEPERFQPHWDADFSLKPRGCTVQLSPLSVGGVWHVKYGILHVQTKKKSSWII